MYRINPRVDFAFKKLFGSEENKDLLLALINAIIMLPNPIIDLELKNPYNLKDYLDGKLSILDIKATDQVGRWYNVEMQINEDLHYDKRALYYWCKLVTEQLREGEAYSKINKTFSINLLSFDFFGIAKGFHNRYRILNVDTCQDDGKHFPLEIHYLELGKFHKKYTELTTALDRWITFLNLAHELDKRNLPATLEQDQNIVKALNIVERMFNEDERLLYEQRLKGYTDEASRLDSAVQKGLEKGREEGKAEGKTEGKAEILKSLITRRFGQLPTLAINKIETADITQLETWAETIFDAKNLEQLLN